MKSPLPEEKLLRRLMRTSLLTNDTKCKDGGRWRHFLILMERRRTNGIADWRRLQSFESLELLPIFLHQLVLVSQIPASCFQPPRSKISWMNCKTSTTMRRTDSSPFKSQFCCAVEAEIGYQRCMGPCMALWAAGNTCQAAQGGGWYVIYGIVVLWWYNQFGFVFDSVSWSSPLFANNRPPNCEFDAFPTVFACEAVQSKLAITQDALNATSARPGSGLGPQI